MRESTISFFKEAFGDKSNYRAKNEANPSTFGDADLGDLFDKDLDPVNGSTMSILKSRRMSAKKMSNQKPPKSPHIKINTKGLQRV